MAVIGNAAESRLQNMRESMMLPFEQSPYVYGAVKLVSISLTHITQGGHPMGEKRLIVVIALAMGCDECKCK
jgi:hypothetical protein